MISQTLEYLYAKRHFKFRNGGAEAGSASLVGVRRGQQPGQPR